jgi:hypothetical protein
MGGGMGGFAIALYTLLAIVLFVAVTFPFNLAGLVAIWFVVRPRKDVTRAASVVTVGLVWFVAWGFVALFAGWGLVSHSVATILLAASALGASFGAVMRLPSTITARDRRLSHAAGD